MIQIPLKLSLVGIVKSVTFVVIVFRQFMQVAINEGRTNTKQEGHLQFPGRWTLKWTLDGFRA